MKAKVVGFIAAALAIALPLHAQQARLSQRQIAGTTPAGLPGIDQNVTFGQLISAINAQGGHIDRLNGMGDLQASGVRLVNVAPLLQGSNMQALNNALERNTHSVADMRAAVKKNVVIMPMLTAETLTEQNVVAVDVSANGTVWVFYRK